MKFQIVFTFLSLAFGLQAQITQLIPDSVGTAMVIDLPKLVKTMPIKEMERYSFMKGLLQPTLLHVSNDIQLSDLGLDFSKQAVFYAGETEDFNYTGYIIAIADAKKFFQHLDLDKSAMEVLKKDGLFLQEEKAYRFSNGVFEILTLNIKNRFLKLKADAIFDERGWEKPYFFWWEENESYPFDDESFFEETTVEWDDWDMEVEELVEDWEEDDWIVEDGEEFEEDFFDSKYQHNLLKDSLRITYQPVFWENWLQTLANGNGLIENHDIVQKALSKGADAFAYINPSLMTSGGDAFYYRSNPFMDFSNTLMKETQQIVFLNITKEGMSIDWDTYGPNDLMRVVEAAGKNKFNKDLLNYIPATAPGYMINSFNGKSAYDKFKEVYLPKFDQSEEADDLLIAAFWTLLDDMLNTQSILELFSANMFLSFNGMQDMRVERVQFDYDEETFEYTEVKEEKIEKLPAIIFGASTPKAFIIEKFLKAFAAMGEDFVKKDGNYYTLKNGPINGIPFYVMIVGDIFIFTNDEDVVKSRRNGFGKQAIDAATQKKILAQPLAYATLNWSDLPIELEALTSNSEERKMLTAIMDKTGELAFSVKNIGPTSYTMSLDYRFHGKYKNGAYYLMELLSAMYDASNMD